MAQATTPTRPAPPGHGRAYAEVHATALALTDDQLDAITAAANAEDPDVYAAAARRLDDALLLIEAEHPEPSDRLPAAVTDTMQSVLARDRGLITAGDFDTLTAAWSAAGLPLPAAITIDDDADGPIDAMTSDRVADELMISTFGDPELYGAALMLTGYNHCELLAYPAVRQFIVRLPDGKLRVAWDELADATEDLSGPLADLPEFALDAIAVACELRRPRRGEVHRLRFFDPENPDNAEVMAIAFAHSLGVGHLLVDQVGEEDLPLVPVALPTPRTGWDPGEA